MAYEDNKAFNAMNNVSPDTDVAGGAIKYSKFQMDMTPRQQKGYKDRILRQLDRVYGADPLKGDLSFPSWIKEARPDRIKTFSRDWEKIRAGAPDPIAYRSAMEGMDPEQSRFTEETGILMRDLEEHTGDFSDILDIIGSDVPPVDAKRVNEPLETRRLRGMPRNVGGGSY